MLEVEVKPSEIGVVIGRWQTSKLTAGHKHLIDQVFANHKKVLILIGTAQAKVTRYNPLPFQARQYMIQKEYPNAIILPMPDEKTDEGWSKSIDEKIREAFDIGSVTLYGSRDSFASSYMGHFPVVKLADSHKITATEIRQNIANDILTTEEQRAGAIYAAYNKYPITHPVIDAAILDEKGNVLLARKKTDPKNQWRFVGGFVSCIEDESFEDTVKREVMEETGLGELGEPEYITSQLVKDWRYEREVDKIMTSFFAVKYIYGKPEAADDISDLEWFDIKKIENNNLIGIVEEHRDLFKKLISYLKKKKGE